MYVFNIDDHWITASNSLSSQPNDWFDSSHSRNISLFTIMQLLSLLCRQTDRDDIHLPSTACARNRGRRHGCAVITRWQLRTRWAVKAIRLIKTTTRRRWPTS